MTNMLSVDELNARFNVENVAEGWEVVHEGLASQYPQHAALLRHRIKALGIDQWLDWDFQQDDLIETLMKPQGCVDQSRALWQLSGRRRYVLTGSPIPNFPRDAFGLMAFSGGDGTAAQPYGYRRGYIEPNWINSVEFAMRGVDRFRDDFVVLEWVTWQFAESLQEGAKREVPKIGNLHAYRAMLAPHVKRRLVCEPDVSRYIKIDPPVVTTHTLDWDAQHLAVYLDAADEFADWYRRSRGDKIACNLVTILARIRAVHFAANYPQYGMEGVERLTGLTSKQRAVITRMREIAAQGQGLLRIRACSTRSPRNCRPMVWIRFCFMARSRSASGSRTRTGGSLPVCQRGCCRRRPRVARATTCRTRTTCSFMTGRGRGASSIRRCGARCAGTGRAC
jgi:hypothetical protein